MAETKNKLPKELQTFKREMKKATFEEKVERYFSISYVIEEYSGQKQEEERTGHIGDALGQGLIVHFDGIDAFRQRQEQE